MSVQPAMPPLCARCNAEPATEGGLLGDRCRAEVKAQTVDYWYPGREVNQ